MKTRAKYVEWCQCGGCTIEKTGSPNRKALARWFRDYRGHRMDFIVLDPGRSWYQSPDDYEYEWFVWRTRK